MSRVTRAVVLALLGGCAPLEVTTRTERGPLLRTFHRPSIVEGATSATAAVTWPTLELRVVGTDTCRDEELAEYAEERVTERSVPSAGPSLSTGIAVTLASAIAFGISYAVSSAPDTSVMDRAGRFGPSSATLVRGWSLAGLGVGLPALAVGIIGYLQSGEEVKHLKVEQVTGQRDAACHERPLSGPVALSGPRGVVARGEAIEGLVRFDAKAVGAPVEEVTFADREVELDGSSLAVVEAFAACGQLELEPAGTLEGLADAAIAARVERLTACRRLRPEAVAPWLQAVQAERSRRRASDAPGAAGAGAPSEVGLEPGSFEEAVSALAPRLLLRAGAVDLTRLGEPQSLVGQGALVQGVVAEAMAQNTTVLQVGERSLFVFLPTPRRWGADFGNGTRVEAVVVMAGSQTVGARTLPAVRAVWMRPLF